MEERKENTLHNLARTANELAKSPRIISPTNEWTKVRKLALRHLNRFVSLEAKVLKGDDPDAIHDMRVASRRLQQVLDLIFPKPLPREARRLRRKIRRCRQVLGEVRNCDVLLQQVEGRLARKRCSDREAWTGVKQHLQERRGESFERAIRKLSKVNLAVFYVHAKEILDRLKPTPDTDPVSPPLVQPDGPTSEPLPARLAQALVGVWSEFEEQVAASHREKTPPSIHAARICAKRLRYLLEVVNQFGIPGSSAALTWLRRIQQHLGDWHDMEVLEEMIIEMIAKPEFLHDQLPLALATGKLILRNRTTKQGFREKYFRMTLDSANYQGIRTWAEGLLAAPASSEA
jgi:CHAD domain-containing protein